MRIMENGQYRELTTQEEAAHIASLVESPEQITYRLTAAIQRHLDAAAQVHRYDSIHTACGWADEFADAATLKAWAANCWRKSTEIELDVAEGNRAIPTEAELISELPKLL